MNAEDLSEQGVRDILVECHGDMIQASRQLCIRPGKLLRYMRTIPSLRIVWLAMEKVKELPEFDTLSTKAFEAEMEASLAPMRLDALESIYELATMPHGQNSSLAEVKLKAAIHLRGPAVSNLGRSDGEGLMHELNTLYQSSAPRIKNMRATLTVEMSETHPTEHNPYVASSLERSASGDAVDAAPPSLERAQSGHASA